MVKRVLEAGLCGLAIFAAAWVAEELRSPYSDLRLWLSDRLEHVKGGSS
jgi:hypothetical protein